MKYRVNGRVILLNMHRRNCGQRIEGETIYIYIYNLAWVRGESQLGTKRCTRKHKRVMNG